VPTEDIRPLTPPRCLVRSLLEFLERIDPVGSVELELSGVDAAGVKDLELTGISQSTRSVQPGDLFAALPGARVHGAEYAADAVAAGARAVLTDRDGAAIVRTRLSRAAGVPVLVVPQPRRVLGSVAAQLYNHPASELTLIGVTGTQGKTTVTHLLYGALQSLGARAAVVGTMGTWIDGQPVASRLTTPEAPELHALFAVMRERRVAYCVMEVSSHAVVQGRVDGAVFDLMVFTNFGRDHLDFHRDEDDYFAAKASMFVPERSRRGLVNSDDPRVRTLLDSPLIPLASYALTEDADWRAADIAEAPTGSTFKVQVPRGAPAGGSQVEARVRLPGRFNVSNALAAIAAGAEAGADVEALAGAVGAVTGVGGRMEVVTQHDDITVVVDYAHKPDAITAALEALRPASRGRRLWVVLGAGGDRDQGKRPLMGAVAAELADVVVVTDDNPRSEDPAAIRTAIAAGVPRDSSVELHEIAGRRAAIEYAVRSAQPGDTVLVAGKGHEQGQEIGGVTHPFDDRAVVRESLAHR
jgi:UDP-N-acetylmuramoyl-L-alanyl-D-glutamate--2,6-diaminopimelate ligase